MHEFLQRFRAPLHAITTIAFDCGYSHPHQYRRLDPVSLASITGEIVPGGGMADVGPTCSAPVINKAQFADEGFEPFGRAQSRRDRPAKADGSGR